ncbi:hypothetical protein pipiens_000932, partial [Culex pipiens pipiens]
SLVKIFDGRGRDWFQDCFQNDFAPNHWKLVPSPSTHQPDRNAFRIPS